MGRTKTHQQGNFKEARVVSWKKPHNYILVIPWPYRDSHKEYTPEQIEKFYELEDKYTDIEKLHQIELSDLGIVSKFTRNNPRYTTREYECEICLKKKYDYQDEF
jgi:hypothetical protein